MMEEVGDGSAQLAYAKGSDGAPCMVDRMTFTKRLQALYWHWREHKDDLWGSADFVAVATPPPTEDIHYLKSSTFNIWLLGYEFPDTIIVFGSKQIHFLCSQKKASLLESVNVSAKEAVHVEVVIHAKLNGEDGTSKMDAVLHSMRTSKSVDHDAPIVGYLFEESHKGTLLEKWGDKLRNSGLQLSDVTDGLFDLFAIKVRYEPTFANISAYLTAYAMENLVVSELNKRLNDKKKAFMDPGRRMRVVKLNFDNVDICYPPFFQCGDIFDIWHRASSKVDYLFYDSPAVIICAIGSRKNNYCSISCARTFLIDANAFQSYQLLFRAHEAALNAVKSGNKVSDVYSAARTVVQMDAPDLEPNLTKSDGTGIGLVCESRLGINLKNDQAIKAGFVYTISLGFQNLLTEKGQIFSLLLGDTVFVTNDGCDVITRLSSKDVKDVDWTTYTEEEQLMEPGVEGSYFVNDDASYSKTLLLSDKQEGLKEEVTCRRLVLGDYAVADNWAPLMTSSEPIELRFNSYCCNVARNFIIDANAAFLTKAYKVIIRAHVAAIRAVKPGNKISDIYSAALAVVQMVAPELVPYLTWNGSLQLPASSSGLAINLKNNGGQVIKAGMVFEISLGFENLLTESGNPSECQMFSLLLEDKVAVTTKLSSQDDDDVKNAAAYEEEVEPMLNKFNPIRLSDIRICPPFDGPGRKMTGALEAHANGFRYTTSRQDEWVDILHTNIKHAFFEPAEKSATTRLHFHLHNHIMVGNEETKDLQFYVWVRGGDVDQMDEEQREGINKNNIDFQNFVNRVHDQFKGLDLEFERPLTKLGFYGEPSDRRIVPTTSCLVELTEAPFLVITISEIAIVNLEVYNCRRVSKEGGQEEKEFDLDMAIVFKDMKRDVTMINCIPYTSLDEIKICMDTNGIKYHISRGNLKWRSILDSFIDDPQLFVDVGGWEFLNLNDASDSDSDSDDDPRPHYNSRLFETSSSDDNMSHPQNEMFAQVLTGELDNVYDMLVRLPTTGM